MMAARARRRRVLDLSIGLGALVVAVGVIAAAVWFNIGAIERQWRGDQSLRQALVWSDDVLDAVQDQDNAIQGYLATGDRRFVAPYESGRQRLHARLAQLAASTASDTPQDRQDAARTQVLVTDWEDRFADPLIAGRTGAASPARANPAKLVQQIEDALETLRQHKRAALALQDATLADNLNRRRVALVAGALAALALALTILGRTARQLANERSLAEAQAARLKAALEQAAAANGRKSASSPT